MRITGNGENLEKCGVGAISNKQTDGIELTVIWLCKTKIYVKTYQKGLQEESRDDEFSLGNLVLPSDGGEGDWDHADLLRRNTASRYKKLYKQKKINSKIINSKNQLIRATPLFAPFVLKRFKE